MSVISNTTVISNFAAINRLDILRALYERLFISTAVYAEIQEGLDEGYNFYTRLNQCIAPFQASG